MTLVLKALNFSKEKHEGQVRKGSGASYFSHPLAVSYIVAAFKQSKVLDELLAAALLHDTFEDTDTTFNELANTFTPLVASLVLELSNDDGIIAKIGKLEYHKKKLAGISSYGLVVKLADRLHNLSDNPTDKMVSETRELMAYLADNRKLTKTHMALVKEIIKICEAKSKV